MAIITGGLHGRARGNVDGIIYGAARTRTGKVVTAREYVMPANPQTAKQVAQRTAFSCSLYSTRHLTSAVWKEDFNRAIGQLPGFQSMMSIILGNMNVDTMSLETPPDTPLGNLHIPEVECITHPTLVFNIQFNWDTGLGLNGTAADTVSVFGIDPEGGPDGRMDAFDWVETAVRSDGTLDVACEKAGFTYVAAFYFQGAGEAIGKLSVCQWNSVQTKM